MENSKESVEFIGIRLMGKPMTIQLLAAGYKVRVWNRNQEKLKPVVAAGTIAAESIKDLVHNSKVILLSLTDTLVVENVVFDDSGIANPAN